MYEHVRVKCKMVVCNGGQVNKWIPIVIQEMVWQERHSKLYWHTYVYDFLMKSGGKGELKAEGSF